MNIVQIIARAILALGCCGFVAALALEAGLQNTNSGFIIVAGLVTAFIAAVAFVPIDPA